MIQHHDKVYPEIPDGIKKTIEASGQKMCKTDNRYQAYYRYLQSIWRGSHNISVKKSDGQSDNDVYGNYTSDPEANFMTDGIRSLSHHTVFMKTDVFTIDIEITTLTHALKFDEYFGNFGVGDFEMFAVPRDGNHQLTKDI